MKLTIAALAALTIAGSAQAGRFNFVPANTDFSATGPITFTISGQPVVTCTASISGVTNTDGTATVTAASFTDDGDGTCAQASPFGFKLGWVWKPVITAGLFDWSHFGVLLGKGIRVGHYGSIRAAIGTTIGGVNQIGIHGVIHSDAGPCTISASLPVTGGISIF
jgi:hypothetical protein